MRKTLSIILLSLGLVACGTAQQASVQDTQQSTIKPFTNAALFVQDTAQQYHIDPTFVSNVLKEAQLNEKVQAILTPKASQKRARQDWNQYRRNALHPSRIKDGIEFLHAHHAQLSKAEQIYGVPASIIASIIGIETRYGKYMGNFKTLDALYTLSFYYPDPSRENRILMFRQQLAALIYLAHEGRIDLNRTYGSYAGAVGYPQFMPLSILNYAVNEQGNAHAKIDLDNHIDDAIMSVGNYFKAHGWVTGMPVFIEHSGPISDEELQAKGWRRVVLKNYSNQTEDVRIATKNFDVIRAYNLSDFYATSVADFAKILETSYGK
ncbi:lytic murein transglycosylase [Basilea psittacipulmonis]|uniref:lytic murein transglycosylase n=1 Tax=Basilea psittacipulmonis TaxID=1472345 RepID=UPI0006898F4F|nr:lytic murein transglycosylase [Basilea psittacipulmonis]